MGNIQEYLKSLNQKENIPRRIIVSIEIVSAQGVGCYHIMQPDVTRIDYRRELDAKDEFMGFYRVWNENKLVAAISENCPMVITFGEE